MSKPELKDAAAPRPNSPQLAKNDKKAEDDSSSDSFQHIGSDPKSATNTAAGRKENGKDYEKPTDKDAGKKKTDSPADPPR